MNPLGEETAIALDNSRNVLSLSRDGSVLDRMEYDQQHRITARHSTGESGIVDQTYSYDPSTGQLGGIHSSNGQDQTSPMMQMAISLAPVFPMEPTNTGILALGTCLAFPQPQ